MSERCEACQFWAPLELSKEYGLCRRNAPLVTGGLHCSVETVWPQIKPNDWCGEYKLSESPEFD